VVRQKRHGQGSVIELIITDEARIQSADIEIGRGRVAEAIQEFPGPPGDGKLVGAEEDVDMQVGRAGRVISRG
jgi:hypothetical protein